jgi:hypothetical protein
VRLVLHLSDTPGSWSAIRGYDGIVWQQAADIYSVISSTISKVFMQFVNMQQSYFPGRVALLQENPALRAYQFLHKVMLNSEMNLFLIVSSLGLPKARYLINVFSDYMCTTTLYHLK